MPSHLERQDDDVIIARVHGPEVEAFHNRDPASQKDLVGPRRRRAELFCRDVIDANEQNAGQRPRKVPSAFQMNGMFRS